MPMMFEINLYWKNSHQLLFRVRSEQEHEKRRERSKQWIQSNRETCTKENKRKVSAERCEVIAE